MVCDTDCAYAVASDCQCICTDIHMRNTEIGSVWDKVNVLRMKRLQTHTWQFSKRRIYDDQIALCCLKIFWIIDDYYQQIPHSFISVVCRPYYSRLTNSCTISMNHITVKTVELQKWRLQSVGMLWNEHSSPLFAINSWPTYFIYFIVSWWSHSL